MQSQRLFLMLISLHQVTESQLENSELSFLAKPSVLRRTLSH